MRSRIRLLPMKIMTRRCGIDFGSERLEIKRLHRSLYSFQREHSIARHRLQGKFYRDG